MPNMLRWGLLSTAQINNSLIGPIRQAKRSELAAVASRDLARGQAYAQEKGIPQVYGSYEALLAEPTIDAIYISLPNGLHAEWTVKSAEAGKHVMCEKPLVTSLEEMNRVEAAATANNVIIFEAFMYLHHPQTLKVKAMIQAGKLGNLQLINSWFNFYLPPADDRNVRLNTDLVGGAAWDVGVYPNSVSIVMVDAGAPVEVWADQIVGESGVDVAMRAQLKFSNGVVAQVSSSFRSAFRQAVYLVGDEGTIFLPEPWKPGAAGEDSRIIFTNRNGSEETFTVPAISPYLCEVEAMEACVLDGAKPVVPPSLSREFLRSMLATYESARSGRVVTL